MNTYYHNPNCSKSRAGLELLTANNIEFEAKEYLTEPMTKEELKIVLLKLGMKPNEIIRTKEEIYKELELGTKNLTEDQWIQAIINNPKLLERPIFVSHDAAVVGRPTDKLEAFIQGM